MKSRSKLTVYIVFAIVFGAMLGILINMLDHRPEWVNTYLLEGLFDVFGRMFISSLKMLVVPLVFVSLVCGVCGLEDASSLGKMGIKTILLYLTTTAIAISIALLLAINIKPGSDFNLIDKPWNSFAAKDPVKIVDVFANIIPSNPIKAAVDGNMLQIIFFALVFGLCLSLLGNSAERIKTFFNDINKVIMKMVMLLMKFAPIGVFALITKIFAEQGLEAIKPMIAYFFVVIGALLLHLFITYSSFFFLFTRLNPLTFFAKMRATMMFAFSTASSNATLPVTMETAINRLGIKRSIASFTLPLGATINMDGTAIMQGVATSFIAQVYNVDLSLIDYLMVILTATLASIGTAGVPGVGLITLAMVLEQVGLPAEGIAIIIGVDRILDMLRTAVNVVGDTIVASIVAVNTGELDRKVFADPKAGEDAM